MALRADVAASKAALGSASTSRPCRRVYTDLVNIDGTDIEQTLKLRIIPFTATIRLLPFGNDRPIQPYIGAGVGVYRWRYSETGEFVDIQGTMSSTGNFVGKRRGRRSDDSRRRARADRTGRRRLRNPASVGRRRASRPTRASPGRRSISAGSTICSR